MLRPLILAAVVVAASVTAPRAQAPGGLERVATVVVAGREFSSGAAQEALLLGVPWTDLGYQLFPRQNVRIRVEYFWAGGRVVPITEDVRQRRPDFDNAKFLFSKAFLGRRPRVVLVADLNRPEVKRGMYWLRDQLRQLGLFVDDVVVDQKDVAFFLNQTPGDAFLSLRLDR